MRASPALQVCITRFGVWHGLLVACIALSGAGVLNWMASMASRQPVAAAVALVISGVCVVCALGLWRTSAMSLRWDTCTWHVGSAFQVGEEPHRVDLLVAIDLGAWMLLKFIERTDSRRARVHWVPVQRRGMESSWHALRCAVYSSRPSPGQDAALRAAISPSKSQE
jgi:hypothetical protein